MVDRLPQRAPFIDLIGLSNPTTERKRALAFSPDYITAYQVWRCFPEESDELLGSLNIHASVFSNHLGFERSNFAERDRFTKSITPAEAEQVYDVVVGAVHEFSRDPDREMYGLLRKAFVKVLKIGVEKSNFAVFAQSHLAQRFGRDNRLDPSEVRSIVARLTEQERDGLPRIQLRTVKEEGISRHEIKDTLETVEKGEFARKNLHQEIQERGRELGLSEDDINAQIFFEYSGFRDGSNMHLDFKRKQIRISGGVLMFPARDPETYEPLLEFKLDEFDPNSPQSVEWYLAAKAQSEAVLDRHKSGEDMRGWYKSSISYSDNFDTDGTLFEHLKARFPDLPINTILEVYLCMHNAICCSHRLDIDISGIYDDPAMLEQRLSELNKAMEELGIQR